MTLRDFIPLLSQRSIEQKIGFINGMLEEIGPALSHAHARGVVHRDIKPENILIRPDEKALLLDFGIAHSEGEERLTNHQGFVGTLQYSAPEQVLGDSTDNRTDLYSLALVCFELLSDERPDDINIEPERSFPILHEKGCGVLEPVFKTALHFEPRRRYQTIKEFTSSLQLAVGEYLDKRQNLPVGVGSYNRISDIHEAGSTSFLKRCFDLRRLVPFLGLVSLSALSTILLVNYFSALEEPYSTVLKMPEGNPTLAVIDVTATLVEENIPISEKLVQNLVRHFQVETEGKPLKSSTMVVGSTVELTGDLKDDINRITEGGLLYTDRYRETSSQYWPWAKEEVYPDSSQESTALADVVKAYIEKRDVEEAATKA